MRTKTDVTKVLQCTGRIVTAYLHCNRIEVGAVSPLVIDVYAAISACLMQKPAPPLTQRPPVSIAKSITENYIICLEDGLPFKSLTRHLGAKYGLTPEQYREKWGLPADYPMVTRAYSRKRSLRSNAMTASRNLAEDFVLEPAVTPVKRSKISLKFD